MHGVICLVLAFVLRVEGPALGSSALRCVGINIYLQTDGWRTGPASGHPRALPRRGGADSNMVDFNMGRAPTNAQLLSLEVCARDRVV